MNTALFVLMVGMVAFASFTQPLTKNYELQRKYNRRVAHLHCVGLSCIFSLPLSSLPNSVCAHENLADAAGYLDKDGEAPK